MNYRIEKTFFALSCLALLFVLMLPVLFPLQLSLHATTGPGTVLGAPGTCAHTFYIDFVGGNDANPGTKVSPWKNQPYMSTGWSGSYSHTTGDCFIFKGGVTWPSASFLGPNNINVVAQGDATHQDYYGVDITWFTGGAWTQPILDGEHAVTNVLWLHTGTSYITVDSIEFKRLKVDTDVGSDSFIYNSGSASGHVLMNNLNLHDIQKTGGVTTNQNAYGGVYFNNPSSNSDDSNIFQNGIVNNQENGVGQPGDYAIGIFGVEQTWYSHLSYLSSGVLQAGRVVCNNTFDHVGATFDPSAHTDTIFAGQWTNQAGVTTNGFICNNLVTFIAGGGNTIIFPNGGSGPMGNTVNMHVYNNVVVGAPSSCIDYDEFNAPPTTNTINTFTANNTCSILNGGTNCLTFTDRGTNSYNTSFAFNNHCIGNTLTGDGFGSPPSGSFTSNHNLAQTVAAANLQGYTELANWIPTSPTGDTVGTGTNLTFTTPGCPTAGMSTLCFDFFGVSRPGGAAAWNKGAYQFSAGGSPTADLSPTSIAFGNIITGNTTGTTTVTLTNNGTVTLNISSIAKGGADTTKFNLVNSCGSTLAQSASCTFTVSFSPTAVTSYTANITVTSDASTSPNLVTLTGAGVAAGTGGASFGGALVLSGGAVIQ